MRLDLPPAFFLGAYIRLAMLGGLGLLVLGAGASFVTPPADVTPSSYGLAQAVVGLLVFLVHWSWLDRAPKTEYEPILRRAYVTLGALAFLAGVAVFAPLALSRAFSGQPALGETIVAALSLGLAVYFAWRVNAELSS
ncbi:MAG: hypothetical protein AUH85_06570 [Chloroflexi bacterium 13_1_40CM_4_68_4]|nr:MAG: hypothetical protein AUH85_06570 [Chloroflexi bacterium 13_1_40CM_4_68_4]